MSNLPPIVSLLLMVMMALSVIWIVSEVGRRAAVRGSRPRYVYATMERATRYPALIYLTVSSALEFQVGSPLFGCLDAIGVALWVWVMHERRRRGDDDDDLWTDIKKKVQQQVFNAAPATNL